MPWVTVDQRRQAVFVLDAALGGESNHIQLRAGGGEGAVRGLPQGMPGAGVRGLCPCAQGRPCSL